MEDVTDKVVAEIQEFSETESVSGGCSDVLTIEAVYWGDPGVIPVNSYPCFLVQPVREVPVMQTTGYDVFDLTLMVTLLMDAREYFDADVLEADGDRKLTRTMNALRRWFRRDSNRTLDDLDGVREVVVNPTDYLVQVRGGVIAKSAQMTLVVNQQRPRQP